MRVMHQRASLVRCCRHLDDKISTKQNDALLMMRLLLQNEACIRGGMSVQCDSMRCMLYGMAYRQKQTHKMPIINNNKLAS